MSKYRKKPVVIEAEQHVGPEPRVVQTLEGPLTAQPGDWIVTGGKGEQWPVRSDIFPTLYDPIPEGE